MSKGGHFLRLALAAGKKLYGHGPSCPVDCACRAAELAVDAGVSMLEGAVAHSRSRKARVPAPPPVAPTPPTPASRPVVVAEVIDVEVIEVDGVPVRPPPRLPSRPRSLPAGRSRR